MAQEEAAGMGGIDLRQIQVAGEDLLCPFAGPGQDPSPGIADEGFPGEGEPGFRPRFKPGAGPLRNDGLVLRRDPRRGSGCCRP